MTRISRKIKGKVSLMLKSRDQNTGANPGYSGTITLQEYDWFDNRLDENNGFVAISQLNIATGNKTRFLPDSVYGSGIRKVSCS